MARKQEVMEAYCRLGMEVATEIFGFPAIPVDCFCNPEAISQKSPEWSFQYSNAVLAFIQDAVRKAIAESPKYQIPTEEEYWERLLGR